MIILWSALLFKFGKLKSAQNCKDLKTVEMRSFCTEHEDYAIIKIIY